MGKILGGRGMELRGSEGEVWNLGGVKRQTPKQASAELGGYPR